MSAETPRDTPRAYAWTGHPATPCDRCGRLRCICDGSLWYREHVVEGLAMAARSVTEERDALCDEITRLRAENEKLHMALDTLGAQVSGFVANVVDDGSEAFAECVRIADVIQTTLMATDA